MKEFLKKTLSFIIVALMTCCLACVILIVWGFNPIPLLKTAVSSALVVIFCMMLYGVIDRK